MQHIRTVWTNVVREHPGILTAEFSQHPKSGFRREDIYVNIVTDGRHSTDEDRLQ